MSRRSFWLGYALAIVFVLWLIARQRRSSFEAAVARLREARPEMIEWPAVGRIQDKLSQALDDAKAAVDRKAEDDVQAESDAHGEVDAQEEDAAQLEDDAQAAEDAETADDVPAPDDLKEIVGIGPAFERRLNEAGITRFTQLAALSEDEVRERMELEPWQGDVSSWIEQAGKLSSGA